MKYAILGDIHSNLEALEAVLHDAESQGVTAYACVGDVVGYNANPVECLEIVRKKCKAVVKGNHDHYCSQEDALDGFHPMAASVVEWTRRQLSDEQKTYLRTLKYMTPLETFTLVHSTLDTPEKWGYVFEKLEAAASFNYQTTTVCFFGHTHVPLAFEKSDSIRSGFFNRVRVSIGKKYFINVGSVGQPRDGDPRAAYVIYDMVNNLIQLRRVDYDFTVTQKKILDAGLPNRIAARLAVGR